MAEFPSLLKRVSRLGEFRLEQARSFVGGKEKEKYKRFVLQIFENLARGGPQNQEAQNRFEKGSTVIFSDYEPGSVFREECTQMEPSPEGHLFRATYYAIWVIGKTDENGRLDLFQVWTDSSGADRFYTEFDPNRIIHRVLFPQTKKEKYEFEIRNGRGNMIDFWLDHNNSGFPPKGKGRSTHQTVALELISGGVREKRKEPKRKGGSKLSSLGQDQPVPASQSVFSNHPNLF